MALVRLQRRPQRTAFSAIPALAGADEFENRMRKFFDEGLLSFDARRTRRVS
jgi:hypothetical protein